MMNVNNFALGFILCILLGLLITIVASYLITSLTIYKVAKEQNHPNAYFSWIPILNNYLMIKLGKGNPLFMLGLLGGIIPYIGNVIILAYSLYLVYMLYNIATEYNVESIPLLIIGIFIPFVLWVQYIKILCESGRRLKEQENYIKDVDYTDSVE